jgi:hypothetical protein
MGQVYSLLAFVILAGPMGILTFFAFMQGLLADPYLNLGAL